MQILKAEISSLPVTWGLMKPDPVVLWGQGAWTMKMI